MHSIKKSLALLVVLSAFAALGADGEVLIRTRDGKSRQGRVLSETQKGYLFAGPKGTSVIAFSDIVDMKQLDAPLPVSVSVPMVAPPPAPSVAEAIAAAPVPEKVSREGFHFGLGANVGVRSGGPIAQGQVHFDFNFGRPAYRLTLNFSSPAPSSSWPTSTTSFTTTSETSSRLAEALRSGWPSVAATTSSTWRP